jgi:RNA polymerase sigma-70 factor (ECF subfamily)
MMTMAMPHTSPADERVGPRGELERLVAQDPMAFRAFVVKNERAVFGLLSRMLGRGPHVEDLAQEAFLRAYRALPSFDPHGPAKVSTWLLTIVTRLALDERKRRKLAVAPDAEVEAVSDQGASSPFRDRARTELRAALEQAARALPDDQCAALVLAEVQGLSLAEVGEVLGVPEATAKTKVFRAREKMRAALAAFGPKAEGSP